MSPHGFRHSLQRWAASVLIAFAPWGATLGADALDYVDATFSVYINNKKAHGENHLVIRHDGPRYRIAFDFEHSLLTVKQEAEFHMRDCVVEPASYRDTTAPALGKTRQQTLTFDQKHKKAVYKSEDQEKQFALDRPLYDPISLFFEARCELMRGKQEFSYPVIRKGSQKTQHFKVTGKQTVETGTGSIDTLVVERKRRSKKRLTRFYVAPELDYLLVMIEHRESRLMTITAKLDQMDYQLVNP